MNKFSNKKGFSLIEMLVAMAIFVIFTGILINSYMGIVGSLRSAEENRILYSEARHVFDVLTEESRNSTVYGGDCEGGDFGSSDSIEFCSGDGQSNVVFKYDKMEGGLYMDGKRLHSEGVKVTHFNFYVWPNENPYSSESLSVEGRFQPKVTFVATFEKEDSRGSLMTYDLQTSVSLRIYK